MKQTKLIFLQFKKNYLFHTLTVYWGWAEGLLLFSSSLRRETHSGLRQAGQKSPLSPVTKLQQHGSQWRSKWGRNYFLLLESRVGVCFTTPWIRASPCPALSKMIWRWKWRCVTSKPCCHCPCRLLLWSSGWKTSGDRGPAFPALPGDCKGDPWRDQQKTLPCPKPAHGVRRHNRLWHINPVD